MFVSDRVSDDAMIAAGLTPREAQVMRYVARGATSESIAWKLGISPRTVEKHLENVLAKVGVTTRGEAIARLRRER